MLKIPFYLFNRFYYFDYNCLNFFLLLLIHTEPLKRHVDGKNIRSEEQLSMQLQSSLKCFAFPLKNFAFTRTTFFLKRTLGRLQKVFARECKGFAIKHKILH